MFKKIFYSAITKIIISFIVLACVAVAAQLLSQSLLKTVQINKDIKNIISSIAIAVAALISYITLFRFYEKRKIVEFSLKCFGRNAAIGLFTGFVLQSLVILVIFIEGGYSILKTNPVSFILPGFAIALSSAIFEEILFRGILFRLIELRFGSIIAIIMSAVIFGLMHLANKNSSLYSAVSIAIQAGILLAAAYIYSKNLWLPIFLHFAWNFAEAGIFGAVISGNQIDESLFTSKFSGSMRLTGGSFGPENSLQATIFCLIAALIFLWMAKKQNKFVEPFWKKRKILAAS